MNWWLALALAVSGLAGAAQADPACAPVTHRDKQFTVCTVHPAEDDLRLFLTRPDGTLFGHFGSVDRYLADTGEKLAFAMNAGMYHADRSPVGLYVEPGRQVQRLITSAGPGNFGMLPNGVLCLEPGRARVIETLAYEAEKPACTYATQSGPMLVIDGELHPRFLPDSDSRYVRNGVGTSEDGSVAVFAISNETVTFHEFGTLFRDVLGLPNALYFDGNISRLHAPALERSDSGFLLGPMVGVVAPKD